MKSRFLDTEEQPTHDFPERRKPKRKQAVWLPRLLPRGSFKAQPREEKTYKIRTARMYRIWEGNSLFPLVRVPS